MEGISASYGLKYFFKVLLSLIGLYPKEKIIIEKLLRKYSLDYLVYCLQITFYKNKLKEIEKSINDIQTFFKNFDIDKEMNEYVELSRKLFKGGLAKNNNIRKREKYSNSDKINNQAKFVKEYPVILSTTFSITNCLGPDFEYDYVIVDEASQVDICTGALAMHVAKHIVIVGDLKQLKHIVECEDEKIFDELFIKHKMPKAYRYTTQSLLSSVSALFKDAPHTLLKEHYRCNPQIIGFCNKKFYNNELIVLSNLKDNLKKTNMFTPLLVYKTCKGNFANDNINQRQIDTIINEVIPNEHLNVNDDSVGITTPYRMQTNELQRAFRGTKVEADTVDKFQGREKKIMIMSTVDNKIRQFTDNPNRINVAVSRAIDQFILVVNGNECDNETIIGELIKYIEYNNPNGIKQSAICSIFDLLYNSYCEEREKYYKEHNNEKPFEFDSENFMYNLIKNTLMQEEYSDLAFYSHYELNNLFKDFNLMTDDERMFVQNGYSHIDFLIYKKITKEYVLGVEVDGINYHKEGTKQYQRDRIKDAIFNKYNLPLIRCSTKGCNEKEKLEQALNNALSINKKL